MSKTIAKTLLRITLFVAIALTAAGCDLSKLGGILQADAGPPAKASAAV